MAAMVLIPFRLIVTQVYSKGTAKAITSPTKTFPTEKISFWGIAQLGERLNGIQEVSGND